MREPEIIAKISWGAELRATLILAWPLIIAQVAGILLFTTDVVMMGWLGPTELAAGALATSLLHPVFLGGLGTITATAPMIAQALGAREIRSVRRTVRQGFWAAFVLSVLMTPVIWNAKYVFEWLHQPAEIIDLADGYLHFAVALVFPGMAFIALRSLLQARGSSTIILLVTLTGIVVNAIGNYALMFGNFGFPRLELVGAGISTAFVNFVMFTIVLVYAARHRRYKRFMILVRLWKPDWPRFAQLFRIGIPIGLTLMSEVGMFGVAVIMMGWLGTNEVAAHAVTLQCAAIAFMVPLGLSQATIIRVGLAVGANNRDGIGKAAWTSLGLTFVFMSITCTLFLSVPGTFVSLFFNTSDPATSLSLSLAVSYLGIAALFQLVDGAQCISGASLRGMSDTRTPMMVAMLGYWIIGLATAYTFGFIFSMRGVGIWIGLATGLAFVAIVLTIRFAMRDRLGLIDKSRHALKAIS